MKPYRAARYRACGHVFRSKHSRVRRAWGIRARCECGTRRNESKKLMDAMYQYPHRTVLLPANRLPCPACSVPSIFVRACENAFGIGLQSMGRESGDISSPLQALRATAALPISGQGRCREIPAHPRRYSRSGISPSRGTRLSRYSLVSVCGDQRRGRDARIGPSRLGDGQGVAHAYTLRIKSWLADMEKPSGEARRAARASVRA